MPGSARPGRTTSSILPVTLKEQFVAAKNASFRIQGEEPRRISSCSGSAHYERRYYGRGYSGRFDPAAAANRW